MTEQKTKQPVKKQHEPLLHIVMRSAIPFWHAWLIRILAVVAALIFGGLVTLLLTGENPLAVYATMIEGSFGTPRRIWTLLQGTAVLLCIALAVTPAFKMRFWNTGAEGQVLIAGMAGAACMLKLADKIPAWAVLAVSIAAAVAAGAVWALIPALFKARFGTNETLFTLMMNYIAIQLVSYFSILWAVPKGSGQIGMINATTKIGWLPQIGNKYLLSILIAAVLTLAMFIYLKYSKHGYEISVVGESENTARYIGIKVKKVVIRTILLSRAVSRLAGALLVLGIDHTVSTHTVGGQGFTGILVSWLGKFNPFYMILTSFLIIFLQKGAGEISSKFSLNDSFSEIITGIIIFFIIGCEFFINYRIVLRAKAKPMLGTGQSRAKGGQA